MHQNTKHKSQQLKKKEIVPLQSVLEELVKRLQFGYVGVADSAQPQ